MALPSRDVQTKVSTDAAQTFVDSYYKALNENRSTVSSFYVRPTPDAAVKPDISLNGNIFADPAAVQDLFVKEMPDSRYDVQAFDCHVVNPNYNTNVTDDSQLGPDKDGNKMSIMVVVSGFVKYGELKDAAMRGFTETFLLIPNPLASGKGRQRNYKKWLIQSQNFRLVL